MIGSVRQAPVDRSLPAHYAGVMKTARRWIVILAFCAFAAQAACAAALKTEHVFLIISDGFRWQELFGGAEEQLLTKTNGGVHDTNTLRQEFWRDTPEARREALLPFFWGTIAKHGQLFGNQNKGSVASVTNGK